MRTAEKGDRVLVHYVKRLQNGSVTSSRNHVPLELTIGRRHHRLPGLGLALVGLVPGESVKVSVPPERAYGTSDVGKIYRLARTRFAGQSALSVGNWVRITDRRGRRRLVRILTMGTKLVVVDNNHPRAGQRLVLEVKLLAIQAIQDVALGSDSDGA